MTKSFATASEPFRMSGTQSLPSSMSSLSSSPTIHTRALLRKRAKRRLNCRSKSQPQNFLPFLLLNGFLLSFLSLEFSPRFAAEAFSDSNLSVPRRRNAVSGTLSALQAVAVDAPSTKSSKKVAPTRATTHRNGGVKKKTPLKTQTPISSLNGKTKSPPKSSTARSVSYSSSSSSPTSSSTAMPPPPSKSKTTIDATEEDTFDDDDDETSGVVGNWESLHGNWVLRPSSSSSSSSASRSSDEPPRAVIHFLGGALVGAAPHITYRYVLERLAHEGFLIVATPYKLSFDHLATCDNVLTRFEDLAPTLARQYGALPVVGIGHSCGALLQLLITCLFPDTPRAANALLSFNNKPVTEAVPFFEEVFAPAFTSIATPQKKSSSSDNGASAATTNTPPPTSNDSLILGLKLAKAATQGKLPSDEVLNEALRVLRPAPPPGMPPFLKDLFPNAVWQSSSSSSSSQRLGEIKVPPNVREAYQTWLAPSVATLADAGVLPLLHQTVISLEQIPQLVEEVAQGARDFNPTPAVVRAAAGKAYRARRTLVLGYDDDSIDESAEVEEVLREARSITRMRRPMVPIDVERCVLQGGHATPLLAPPLEVAEKTENLLGMEASRERLGYLQAEATAQQLLQWLEEGNL